MKIIRLTAQVIMLMVANRLRIGYSGFGKVLDPFTRLYFNKSFQNALDEHCKIEWYKLAEYLNPA
jgi:hypothetical protein